MNIFQLLLLIAMLLLSVRVLYRGGKMLYYGSSRNPKGIAIGTLLVLGGGFFVIWLAMMLYEEV